MDTYRQESKIQAVDMKFLTNVQEKQDIVLAMIFLEKTWNPKFINKVRREMITMVWPCETK
jgi:hypothetical protein